MAIQITITVIIYFTLFSCLHVFPFPMAPLARILCSDFDNQKIFNVSQVFVKEGHDQWLHEIQPTMDALIHFLTRKNGGIRFMRIKAISARSKPGRCMK